MSANRRHKRSAMMTNQALASLEYGSQVNENRGKRLKTVLQECNELAAKFAAKRGARKRRPS